MKNTQYGYHTFPEPVKNINRVLKTIHKENPGSETVTVVMIDEVIPCHNETGLIDFRELNIPDNIICIISVCPSAWVKDLGNPKELKLEEIVSPKTDHLCLSERLLQNQRNAESIRHFHNYLVQEHFQNKGYMTLGKDQPPQYVKKGDPPVWLRNYDQQPPSFYGGTDIFDELTQWSISKGDLCALKYLLSQISDAAPEIKNMDRILVIVSNKLDWLEEVSGNIEAKWNFVAHKNVVGIEDENVVLLNVPLLPELISRATSQLFIVGCFYGYQHLVEAAARNLIKSAPLYYCPSFIQKEISEGGFDAWTCKNCDEQLRQQLEMDKILRSRYRITRKERPDVQGDSRENKTIQFDFHPKLNFDS